MRRGGEAKRRGAGVRSSLRPVTAFVAAAIAIHGSGCTPLYPLRAGKAGVDYWFTEISGDIRLNVPAVGRTTVDLEDTLDLEPEQTPSYRAQVQLGNVTIEGSFFDVEYSGNETIETTFTFGGQTFKVGAQVASDFEILFAGGKAKFGLIEIGPAVLGGIIGGNYVELDARASISDLSAREDLMALFPVAGAIVTLHQPIGRRVAFFCEAELSGVYIPEISDREITFFEASARGGLEWGPARLGAGYRLGRVDIDDMEEDVKWDVAIGGPFAFVELAF